MIRQEKRKRRWLENNGFVLLTDETVEDFKNEALRLGYGVPSNPKRYFAYKTINHEHYSELYVLSPTEIKGELHEIKLDYIVRSQGTRPVSKVMKLVRRLKRIHSQWAALIRHGVNPWW